VPRAQLDPALSVRVLGTRELRYTDRPALGEDRPHHVRAASGLAVVLGRLAVIQDDTAFIAFVAGDDVTALPLPRGPGGRRRFEVAIGNKHEKLDLEACVAIGDELWAFGSGSTPAREKIALLGYGLRLQDGAPLYRRIREEVGNAINIEGVASVGDEVRFFHRGNTGPDDRGPMVVCFARGVLSKWLASIGPVPEALHSVSYDLGTIDGVRLGFTDAIALGERVFYLAAAEASSNAIDDGGVVGSQLGVIEGSVVRAAVLADGGVPLKAEGLAFDPNNPRRAWITIDPDDVGQPARLYEVELVGPW